MDTNDIWPGDSKVMKSLLRIRDHFDSISQERISTGDSVDIAVHHRGMTVLLSATDIRALQERIMKRQIIDDEWRADRKLIDGILSYVCEQMKGDDIAECEDLSFQDITGITPFCGEKLTERSDDNGNT